jgi:hypothetical protein
VVRSAEHRRPEPSASTLHDVGHQDGTDFLVMEYLDGETLARDEGTVHAFQRLVWLDQRKHLTAVSSAADGPFPDTSPSANPKLPSGRSRYSMKSPPMARHGIDAPIASQ